MHSKLESRQHLPEHNFPLDAPERSISCPPVLSAPYSDILGHSHHPFAHNSPEGFPVGNIHSLFVDKFESGHEPSFAAPGHFLPSSNSLHGSVGPAEMPAPAEDNYFGISRNFPAPPPPSPSPQSQHLSSGFGGAFSLSSSATFTGAENHSSSSMNHCISSEGGMFPISRSTTDAFSMCQSTSCLNSHSGSMDGAEKKTSHPRNYSPGNHHSSNVFSDAASQPSIWNTFPAFSSLHLEDGPLDPLKTSIDEGICVSKSHSPLTVCNQNDPNEFYNSDQQSAVPPQFDEKLIFDDYECEGTHSSNSNNITPSGSTFFEKYVDAPSFKPAMSNSSQDQNPMIQNRSVHTFHHHPSHNNYSNMNLHSGNLSTSSVSEAFDIAYQARLQHYSNNLTQSCPKPPEFPFLRESHSQNEYNHADHSMTQARTNFYGGDVSHSTRSQSPAHVSVAADPLNGPPLHRPTLSSDAPELSFGSSSISDSVFGDFHGLYNKQTSSKRVSYSPSSYFPPSPRNPAMCRYFQQGYCKHGERCKFSHNIGDCVLGSGASMGMIPRHRTTSRSAPTSPARTFSSLVSSQKPYHASDVPVGVVQSSKPSLRSVDFPSHKAELDPAATSIADRPLTLDQVVGQIHSLCKDQHGCRFLQKKLEEGTLADIAVIFGEVFDCVVELMTDPFGNYLCQKLVEYCSSEQRTIIVEKVASELVYISLNMHGTRAVQKMIECLDDKLQVELVVEALGNSVVTLIKDLNGNHVIQRCLQRLNAQDNQFIYDAVAGHCIEVATHRHGCCVLQRCIDHASTLQRLQLVSEITSHAVQLMQDAFGNYVVQYVLDLKNPEFADALVNQFLGHAHFMATQKFSSNVIEKCLRVAGPVTRDLLLD
eukprot:Sdes_comp20564_c0_seq1m15420